MRSAEKTSNLANGGCDRCAKLEKRIERLGRQNEELRRRLDEAQRAEKRQAAPFSKGDPKKNPKKPGRKPGKDYGTTAHGGFDAGQRRSTR